jgi:hypothetical protein
MTVMAALEDLARRNLPIGTWGILRVVPADGGEPRAWAVIVDSRGPRLVHVEGERVEWTRYAPERGHVFVSLVPPHFPMDPLLVGVHRPKAYKFAYGLHEGFQEASGHLDENERPVLVPEIFPAAGMAGVRKVLALVKKLGKGASGVLHTVSEDAGHEVWTVINDGRLRIVGYDIASFTSPNQAKEARKRGRSFARATQVRAIVVGPDGAVRAGQVVSSVAVTPESGRQTPFGKRRSREMGQVVWNFDEGAPALGALAYEREAHRSAAPARLTYAGDGITAVATVIGRLLRFGGAAVIAGYYPDPHGGQALGDAVVADMLPSGRRPGNWRPLGGQPGQPQGWAWHVKSDGGALDAGSVASMPDVLRKRPNDIGEVFAVELSAGEHTRPFPE